MAMAMAVAVAVAMANRDGCCTRVTTRPSCPCFRCCAFRTESGLPMRACWYGVPVWCAGMVCWYGVPVWCAGMVCWYGVLVWYAGMVCWYGVLVAFSLNLTGPHFFFHFLLVTNRCTNCMKWSPLLSLSSLFSTERFVCVRVCVCVRERERVCVYASLI